MGTEERKAEQGCLTSAQWANSQVNELAFWDSQYRIDNLEQIQRNHYYRNTLEDGCNISKEFFAQDFSDLYMIDVGSGPQGILTVLKARMKLAVDPLMGLFKEAGYDIDLNGVFPIVSPAESFIALANADYMTCLNALDHMRDPAEALKNMADHLKLDGELLLITDMRKEDQLDAYHKMVVSRPMVNRWLLPYFTILESEEIGHQAGNPIRQLVIRCKKKYY